MLKKVLIATVLSLSAVSAAYAVPPCWPGSPSNVGPARSLSYVQLNNWWALNGVPAGVTNPHYYVAFHASDEVCKASYGASAWAVITGPSSILSTLNGYTISQGLSFQCQRCSRTAEPVPTDPVPSL